MFFGVSSLTKVERFAFFGVSSHTYIQRFPFQVQRWMYFGVAPLFLGNRRAQCENYSISRAGRRNAGGRQ